MDFSVHGPADIQAQQDKQIDEVSQILGQPSAASAILLRHLRWNKERLILDYMERPETLLDAAGLGSGSVQVPKTQHMKGFTCTICYDDESGIETYALKCGHRYCVDCYRQYLAMKIKDEGEAARIQCPTERCHHVVDSKSMDLLVAAELKARFVDEFYVGMEFTDRLCKQIPRPIDTHLCRRHREAQVVSCTQLRVRCRVRHQATRPPTDSTHG